MSLKDIKQQTNIKLLEEDVFNKEIKSKKINQKKTTHCVSVYFTEAEYEILTKARGDVAQALFCRKIIIDKLKN